MKHTIKGKRVKVKKALRKGYTKGNRRVLPKSMGRRFASNNDNSGFKQDGGGSGKWSRVGGDNHLTRMNPYRGQKFHNYYGELHKLL